MTTAAKELVAREAYDPHYGARPVKRYMQKHVETEIAEIIIRGSAKDGDKIIIDADVDGLTFKAE